MFQNLKTVTRKRASVSWTHTLERRCIFFFSKSGNFNSIWQLLHFSENSVLLFLVQSRAGMESIGGGLGLVGLWWRCCFGVMSRRNGFVERDLPSMLFLLLTKALHSVGVMIGRWRKKKETIKCGRRSNWFICSDFHFSNNCSTGP